MPGADWLYLFSSNQTPLYSQDILNVLAAPDGLHYTFRYDANYVEHETAAAWATLEAGTRLLVVFSLQQSAKYHPAVFLPVRTGELVEAYKVGTRYFVRFALRNIVSLAAATTNHDKRVQAFTEELRTRLRSTPYETSASLGAPSQWTVIDPDTAFEQSVDYLSRTETFRMSRFYRVRRIAETGRGGDETPIVDGVLELQAGRTYDLEILLAQRAAPPTPERFDVDVDGSTLELIGHRSFEVASRYDRPVIRALARPVAGLENRESVLDIRPHEHVRGPALTIPIRVVADKTRAVAVAAGQALGLILVALAATLTMFPLGIRIAFAVVGAIAAAALQLVGTASLAVPSMPDGPTPTAATAPAPPASASR